MDKKGKSKRNPQEVLTPSYHENYEEEFEEERRDGWVTSILIKSAYEKGFREGTRLKGQQLDRILAGSLTMNLIFFILIWLLIFLPYIT